MNTLNNSSVDKLTNKYLDLRPNLPPDVAEIMDELMEIRNDYLREKMLNSRTHRELDGPDEWHITKFF